MYRLQSPKGTVHRPKTEEARDALLSLGYEDLDAVVDTEEPEEPDTEEPAEPPAPKRTRAPRKSKDGS